MKEYIERQIAENKLGEAMPKLETPDGRGENDYERKIAQETFADAIGVIHNIPAEDVVEVVHGKWETEIDDELGILKHTCQACGFVKRTDIHVALNWNYCPNCGAKMDLEE